jgi:hypothetical protein
MTYRVAVFRDGTGTYPAGKSTYDSLEPSEVCGVVERWLHQSDVLSVNVERV